MLANQDPIFNIPYSLPSNTHSIAIATRRPTTGFSQSTKYMPDYGGVLEIPGGNFKNNGLASGYPFFPNPYYIRLISNEPEQHKGPCSVDCLAISSYLSTSQEPAQFTTIRAIGPKLFFDSTEQIFSDSSDIIEGVFESTTYAHVPYPYNISGIKYNDELDDLLMVKFSRGLKLLQLNKSYKIPQVQPEDELNISFPEQSAIDFIESFPEKKGYTFRDACISQHSRGLIALASSCDKNLQVRFFDMTRSSRTPYNTIQRSLVDDSLGETSSVNRRQSLRSFVPAKTSTEYIQQLDCDRSHLFNVVLTTTHQIALIDPRQEGFGNTIVDKSSISSLMPSEMFIKTNLSRDCDHQIYCMSNMNLRIFDKRFPSNPITTIAHMLEPLSHESMNMQLVDINEGLETLCMSSSGRLAMVTFDRSRATTEGDPVITPRSTHSPVHEPSPAELTGRFSDELIGLATTTKGLSNKGFLFTAAQLSQDGDVCIRAYTPYKNQDFSRRSQADIIISQNKTYDFKSTSRIENPDLDERVFSNNQEHTNDDREYIDLSATDDVSALGEELTSTRASKKFESMRYKLRRR